MLVLRGYSLLECLVVLTIVAILAALGVPALHDYQQRSQDQLLQQQLKQVMQFAAQSADNHSANIGLLRKADTLIVFIDRDQDGLIRQDSQILYRMRLNLYKGALHMRSYPVYRSYFLFKPIALVDTDNGLFWYCRAKQTKPVWSVMVNKANQVQATYPDRVGEIRDSRGRVFAC